MPVITEDKQLHDFSLGIISALIIVGETGLDDQHRTKLHQGFVNAFQHVQSELGIADSESRMQIDNHGAAADVDHIMYFWRRHGYSEKEGTSSLNYFLIERETAELLLGSLPGDNSLYVDAANKLLAHMVEPYVPTPH